jgi:hypothetical protein
MENEELIQNNQTLAIERNDLKEEVAHLESRMIARNKHSEVSTTDSLIDDVSFKPSNRYSFRRLCYRLNRGSTYLRLDR